MKRASDIERRVESAETCLACGGTLGTVLRGVFDTRFGVPDPYDIARCGTCDLEQTAPRPPPEALAGLYERYYNFGGECAPSYDQLRQRFFTSPLYRLWLALDGDVSFHLRRGGGRMLDIGCNEGRGLVLYAKNGFATVEGLETNGVAAAVARRRGFTVHMTDLRELEPGQGFDVAILSNVLEHAPDPYRMLVQVKRVLKPGAEAWISCPNAVSWGRSLFGRAWINWHVPFHITHFTRDTLAATLRRAGFEVLSIDQVTPALWIAQSCLAALTARPGRPTVALREAAAVCTLMVAVRVLLFPLLKLGDWRGRGDCLVAVARSS